MNAPEHFLAVKDYAAYRPARSLTLPEAIEMVRQAIAFTREQQIPKLLIDTTQLTGYGTLGTLERFSSRRNLGQGSQFGHYRGHRGPG